MVLVVVVCPSGLVVFVCVVLVPDDVVLDGLVVVYYVVEVEFSGVLELVVVD